MFFFILFYFLVVILLSRSKRKESGFQDGLRKDLEELLPGCMIFKMDQQQGIPDLLVLYQDKWFSLECKQSKDANHQPNQDYYVDEMNRMSFSRFIYPENKGEILNEIRRSFKA